MVMNACKWEVDINVVTNNVFPPHTINMWDLRNTSQCANSYV